MKAEVPGMLTCRQVEQFLTDYLEGQMSLWIWCKFRFHLMLCADCRNYLEDYRKAVALGRHIFTHPENDAIGNVPDAIIEVILKARKAPRQ